MEEPSFEIGDTRAGAWPVQCAKDWCELIRNCVTGHRKRISSMVVVLRHLQELEATHCAAFAQIDAATTEQMRDLLQQLDNVHMHETLQQRDARQREQANQRVCVNCNDRCALSQGVGCKGSSSSTTHFLCKGCFIESAREQLLPENRNEFKAQECSVLCRWCLFEPGHPITKFSDLDIASVRDPTLLASISLRRGGGTSSTGAGDEGCSRNSDQRAARSTALGRQGATTPQIY